MRDDRDEAWESTNGSSLAMKNKASFCCLGGFVGYIYIVLPSYVGINMNMNPKIWDTFYLFPPKWGGIEMDLLALLGWHTSVMHRPFVDAGNMLRMRDFHFVIFVFPESDREGFLWEKHYHQRLPKWSLSWKTVIKDYRSHPCLERLSSKTTSVMAVCKDCHRRLEKRLLKWCLSWKTVIKDCRSDPCLERLSSKTSEVIAVLKDCHQRLPKWWLSVKTVIKDCRSDGCLERLSSKTTEVMAVIKD